MSCAQSYNFAAQVDSQRGCEIYELVWEMAKRKVSKSNQVDKLSGLFYLNQTISSVQTKLPCYDANMDIEDAWKQSFHLPPDRMSEISFDFPYRGSDKQ